MAGRRITRAQAKDLRNKKVAGVLLVVFVVVCVVQVPKLMKALHPKAPTQAAVASPVTPSSSEAPPAQAAAGTTPASLPVTQVETQLNSFRLLPLKDPFHALVNMASLGADASAQPGQTPAAQVKAKPPAKPKSQAQPTASGVVGFSAKAPPPNAAVVKTNGHKQTVFIGDAFPNPEPLFTLVALSDKTIRLGVLGGSFTSGKPTIRLAKGKRVTLANQADGSHYVIQLVRLTNATPPTTAPASTAPASTTTPSTTG